MDNEQYLFKLQEAYLAKSKAYMNLIQAGRTLSQLTDLAFELRCLLTEIKAVKEEIERKNK